MRSLEYRIKDDKVYFYDRQCQWEGIDRPDYVEIQSMPLGHAENFIKDLQQNIDKAKLQLIFPVNGHQLALSEMQLMVPVMQDYLRKYGIGETVL